MATDNTRTFRSTLKEHLEEHGLWPDEADAVLRMADTHPLFESMKERMDARVDDYPLSILAVLQISIREIALEWIDANKPLHFARVMFLE